MTGARKGICPSTIREPTPLSLISYQRPVIISLGVFIEVTILFFESIGYRVIPGLLLEYSTGSMYISGKI